MNHSAGLPAPLFDDAFESGGAPRPASGGELPALQGLERAALYARLNENGWRSPSRCSRPSSARR